MLWAVKYPLFCQKKLFVWSGIINAHKKVKNAYLHLKKRSKNSSTFLVRHTVQWLSTRFVVHVLWQDFCVGPKMNKFKKQKEQFEDKSESRWIQVQCGSKMPNFNLKMNLNPDEFNSSSMLVWNAQLQLEDESVWESRLKFKCGHFTCKNSHVSLIFQQS